MAHASDQPREKGSKRKQYHFWRGLWNLVVFIVRPDDWRVIVIGIFLIFCGVGAVTNGEGFWEIVGGSALGVLGIYYTCAAVIALSKK